MNTKSSAKLNCSCATSAELQKALTQCETDLAFQLDENTRLTELLSEEQELDKAKTNEQKLIAIQKQTNSLQGKLLNAIPQDYSLATAYAEKVEGHFEKLNELFSEIYG